ncbi:MAG: hypothetical protein WA895_16335 [Streptosporangiaceae bacterium]
MALMRGAGGRIMLAGMDTSCINHMMPGGHGPYWERSIWTVIGITLAVLLTIGGLAVVGVTVALFVSLSHYGSNK